jgi:hypothetical protein
MPQDHSSSDFFEKVPRSDACIRSHIIQDRDDGPAHVVEATVA